MARAYTIVNGFNIEFIHEGKLPMINGRQVEYVDEKHTDRFAKIKRRLNKCALLWMVLIPVVCFFFFPRALCFSNNPFFFFLYLIVFRYVNFTSA